MSVAFAMFCAGVIVGLVIGPDSEREMSAKVDGWIAGYRFAKRAPPSPLPEGGAE